MDKITLQKRWVRIGLYMLIALSFSYLFRVNPPLWYQQVDLPAVLEPFKRLLGALGVLIGAVVVERLHPTQKEITIGGTVPSYSLLMISLPVLLFTLIGVPNSENVEPHLFGLVIGLQALLWVFLEEYGWRGYLQNELSDSPPMRKYLIIGVLWFCWHLWFLNYKVLEDPVSFLTNMVVGLVIIVGASWGIGAVADRTKSVLAGACFHMLGSFVRFNPTITENVDEQTRWIVFSICLAFWIFMLRRWKKTVLEENTVVVNS